MNHRNVYCSAVAQHQNLGDVILRRQMIELFSDAHTVRVLATGDLPKDYLPIITQSRANVLTYRSRTRWLLHLASSTAARRAAIVYSPGPQLVRDSIRTLSGELLRLTLSGVLRLSGCQTYKIGRSFEGSGRIMTSLIRLHSRLLSLSTTRDTRNPVLSAPPTKTFPDVALSWGDAIPEFMSGQYLAVSVRYDRDHNVEALGGTVRKISQQFDLQPVVVSQVSYDDSVSAELAEELKCRLVTATAASSKSIEGLKETLRESQMVLSDRLHSLIFGVCHGALPVVIDSRRNAKCTAALQEAEIPWWDAADVTNLPITPQEWSDEAQKGLEASRRRLDKLAATVEEGMSR